MPAARRARIPGGNRNHAASLQDRADAGAGVLLYETSTNQTFRQVFLDGRPPADPQPSGVTVGRWEGDTLVIETTGLNGRAWIDTGRPPQTEAARDGRFTRRPGWANITIDDPKAY
jgi:hypothetical protein